ncbi:MAG TPA: chemotaxis protein, partial [Sphingomonas sp.]|nr:chemotaxis protein [Sphingomonas sp.]
MSSKSAPTHPPAGADIAISIRERISAFDGNGTLAATLRELFTILEPRLDEISRAFWEALDTAPHIPARIAGETLEEQIHFISAYNREKYTNIAGQRWVDIARSSAALAEAEGLPLYTMFAASAASYDMIARITYSACGDDIDKLARLTTAARRVSLMEAEVMAAFVSEFRARQASAARSEQADLFQNRVASDVSLAFTLGEALRGQAADASSAARGMLGKASEVAAAAEQSAVAMREAAHT